MARETNYAARSDGGSLEALSLRLTAEVRENVRELRLAPVLSPDWCQTTARLQRLGAITEQEKLISKTSADSTLWEGEELALRFLLEDGKLNLALRLLDDYCSWIVASADKPLQAGEAALCARFEWGVGVLLANAWAHKEAVQTSDLPLLTSCMTRVMQHALRAPPPRMQSEAGLESGAGTAAATADAAADLPALPQGVTLRALESIVLLFVAALARTAASINEAEGRIVGALIKGGVFDAAFQHLHANWTRLEPGDLAKGLEGLATLVATEEFQTNKAKAVPSKAGVTAVAQLKDDVIGKAPLDAAQKRKLRPLIDLSTDLQRSQRH